MYTHKEREINYFQNSSYLFLSCWCFLFLSFFFIRFYLFTFKERDREGEREGEKHQYGRDTWICCLWHAHNWGPGRQPRHILWLGIKLATFWFTGQHSLYWATPARAFFSFLFPCYPPHFSYFQWDFSYNSKLNSEFNLTRNYTKRDQVLPPLLSHLLEKHYVKEHPTHLHKIVCTKGLANKWNDTYVFN